MKSKIIIALLLLIFITSCSSEKQTTTTLSATSTTLAVTTTTLEASTDGVTLKLLNYTFEKKGEDWGKITNITIAIDNKGEKMQNPNIRFSLADNTAQWTIKQVNINNPIEAGQNVNLTLKTDYSFSSLNNDKEMRITLVDGYSDYKVALAIPMKFI